MNKSQKKIINVVTLVCSSLFCLSTIAVSTFAWFQLNNSVAAKGMEVDCADPKDSLDYEILKYSDERKAGVSYKDVNTHFVLPDYDTYIEERNKYSNVILRTVITLEDFVTNNQEVEIDITRVASQFIVDGKINNRTSNVVQFKSSVRDYTYVDGAGETKSVNNSSLLEYATDADAQSAGYASIADAKYRSASSYFAGRDTPTTFVAVRGESVVKNDDKTTIKIIPSVPEGYTVKHLTVYIECSYHKSLVNAYIESHSEDTAFDLAGDISKIEFKKVPRTDGKSATGKYVRVESDAAAIDGKYLLGMNKTTSPAAQQILNGALATGPNTVSSATGINVDNNFRDVEIHDDGSINSSDEVDAAALDYDHVGGTFKTTTGYYIGNSSQAAGSGNGIAANESPANLGNIMSFNEKNSVIQSSVPTNGHYFGKYNNKFAWYSAQNNKDFMETYRYAENTDTVLTLKSIAVTSHPSEAQRTYYVGETFRVPGLVVTATYSQGTGSDVQIDVTAGCKFFTTNGKRLYVGTTVFTADDLGDNKLFRITYSEGGIECALSTAASPATCDPISVKNDYVEYIYRSADLGKTLYYQGESLDLTGLRVNAHYHIRSESDVTSSCTFKINGNTVTSGYVLNTAGSFTLTASYPNVSDITVGTLNVTAYHVEFVDNDGDPITTGQAYVNQGSSFKLRYNANVTFSTNTPTGDCAVTLSATTASYSGQNHADQEFSLGITPTHTGTIKVRATINGTSNYSEFTLTVSEMAIEHFSITSSDVVTGSSYGEHTNTVDGRNYIVTCGGGVGYVGANSTNIGICNLNSSDKSKYAVSPVSTSDTATAFALKTSASGISKITVSGAKSNAKDNNATVYLIYSADNISFEQISCAAQGTSINSTDNTVINFEFTPRVGYFAVIFKSSASSGDFRIKDVSIEFNKVVLDHISISGIATKNIYNYGETFEPAGLTLTAHFDDGSSEPIDLDKSGVTWNPTTLTTSTTVTCSYELEGVTKSTTYNVQVVKTIIASMTPSISMYKGGTGTLTPVLSVGTDGGTNTISSISWTTSNSSVATVTGGSTNATVTGAGGGTATITATLPNGNTKTASVTVYALNGITVKTQPTKTAYQAGETLNLAGLTLTAAYTNSGASKTISYGDTGLSTSPAAGYTFTAADVTAGSKTITVTYVDAGVTKTTSFSVTCTSDVVPVTGVTLNKTSTTIAVNSSETLTATVNPSNATDKSVTWSTSNSAVATVSNGTVTAKSSGTATITVTTVDGNYTATCTVTVPSSSTTVTWDTTQQGYTNQQVVTSASIDANISFGASKGSGSNDPKYYTSGTAIRVYAKGYFTVTASNGKKITQIVITFGSSDGSNAITVDVGSLSGPTWTGSASSVKFTIGGSNGNRRIMVLTVTYE